MATADAYIAVLESWLAQGIHEDPAHSNRTPIGVEFGWNGVAWCCETMSVTQERVGLHCFHTASVDEAKHEAIQGLRGMVWLRPDAVIARADLAVFDFGPAIGQPKGKASNFHISCVVDPGTQAKFQTIGGNENDAITKQWRDRKYIQGFIRLPFDHLTPQPQPEDDDMAKLIHPTEGPDKGAQFIWAGDTIVGLSDANVAVQLQNHGLLSKAIDITTLEWDFLQKNFTVKR